MTRRMLTYQRGMRLLAVLVSGLLLISLGACNTTTSNPRGNNPYNANLELMQINFELDGDPQPNANIGYAKLNYLGSNDVLYFNLYDVTHDLWLLHNFPIASVEGARAQQTLWLPFPLGTIFGEDVSSARVRFQVSEESLIRPNDLLDPQTINLADFNYLLDSGEQKQPLPKPKPEANPFAELEALLGDKVTASGVNTGFPNQEQGDNECAPGAISNSLKFLNEQHDLNMEDIEIDDMKKATGWTEDGAPADTSSDANWWTNKGNYMGANGYPIDTTTSTSFDDALAALQKNHDVELRVPGHVMAVVGLITLASGASILFVAHDVEQGKAGGTIVEPLIYDPSDGSLTGANSSYSFERFVIESPAG